MEQVERQAPVPMGANYPAMSLASFFGFFLGVYVALRVRAAFLDAEARLEDPAPWAVTEPLSVISPSSYARGDQLWG